MQIRLGRWVQDLSDQAVCQQLSDMFCILYDSRQTHRPSRETAVPAVSCQRIILSRGKSQVTGNLHDPAGKHVTLTDQAKGFFLHQFLKS